MAAPTPAPAVVPVPAATPVLPKPAGLSLSAAIQLYTESESPTLNPNTWSQRQRAFDSLKATLGEATAVSTITREQAGEWAHGLITRVPSDGGNPMTKRTAANTVSHAAQLFVFLAKRGKFEGTNPIKGVVVMSKRRRPRAVLPVSGGSRSSSMPFSASSIPSTCQRLERSTPAGRC